MKTNEEVLTLEMLDIIHNEFHKDCICLADEHIVKFEESE